MATLTGLWVIHDTPNLSVYNSDGYIWQNNLSATSNGKDIRTMQITETDQTISYATKEGWFDIYVDNKWVDEAYKILDFGEREALVSDEFYTWFTANASNGAAENPEPVKQYLILEDSLKHVADGFRSSRGTTQEYTLSEMAAMAAEPVPTPKIEPLIVTENGTYDIADYVDGYGPVTVNVSGGSSENNEDALIARTITSCTNTTAESIGAYAFTRCSMLASVDMPNAKTIDYNAFYSCDSLTTASFPSVTDIGTYAFQNCKALTTADFPTATSIASYAFESCYSLANINFPALTSMENNAFRHCSSIVSASFPAAITIGSYAFDNCISLTDANFPSVTTISDAAFSYCLNLTNISFPSATTIGSYAFRTCRSLSVASFPAAAKISSYAFSMCSSLTNLYLMGSSLCSLASSNAFSGTGITSTTGSIYVPASMLTTYQAATRWKYFSTQFVAGD